MMSLHRIAVTLGLLTMLGCAKPPHRELDAANYMVARANALEAPTYAPTEYQAAYDALQDAETSMLTRNYGEAEESLQFALLHARRSIDLTWEVKVALATEEEARRQAEAEQLASEQTRIAGENTHQITAQVKPSKPKPAPKPTPKPKRETEPEPTKPATIYEVGEGETLWTIAENPVVYGDGFLWPLLYQANRDQIKDPRQIYPGQTLNIRRDLTDQEIEDARQKARESDIFPLPAP